ncbi:MFS transporter [Muribaculum sp. NM65_B17]|uniref:MFS transporter n=1 Tax=unclassified Muribaculum TaxID=2622126 RepID=UPI00109370A4|nr:MFS transporter [Muribaculum sp. NM65_B17]TGY05685.1 MFS transporter [Muribaculum sp. NM65_B17]THG43795.1 MFS transporter [Muribaculaceae bacterium]
MEMSIKSDAVQASDKGFYKLSWTQRIGFGSGDLAQNLIYQTISMYLLFFYTNVYGLDPGVAAIMFLIVRIVDVIWDPLVGTFVDKHDPKLGKYRAYLILGGVPLTGFAILCFWNGFSGSLLYAYITYVGLSMCYTLVNVPYGALNASLTRDTNEITILTSVRMFMANVGGLAVGMGLPIVVKLFDPSETSDLSSSDSAWFITMTIYGLVGLALLIFCFTQCRERVVMDKSETENVKVSDLWLEFVRNKPLRILAFFFITAFAMMAIGNSAGAYYINYNLSGTAGELSIFMGLGSIPAFIFMPMIPAIKRKVGKKGMFYIFLITAIIGMAMLYVISMVDSLKEHMMLVYIAQFVKSTGVIVATGYMWALVPEVISYGEYTHGRRISGIVNALTGIFYKAGMALGGVVPGLVLAFVDFNKDAAQQTLFAQQGILWLVAVIPAILLLLAMFIISKYDLDDERIDQINKEIEMKHNNQ